MILPVDISSQKFRVWYGALSQRPRKEMAEVLRDIALLGKTTPLDAEKLEALSATVSNLEATFLKDYYLELIHDLLVMGIETAPKDRRPQREMESAYIAQQLIKDLNREAKKNVMPTEEFMRRVLAEGLLMIFYRSHEMDALDLMLQTLTEEHQPLAGADIPTDEERLQARAVINTVLDDLIADASFHKYSDEDFIFALDNLEEFFSSHVISGHRKLVATFQDRPQLLLEIYKDILFELNCRTYGKAEQMRVAILGHLVMQHSAIRPMAKEDGALGFLQTMVTAAVQQVALDHTPTKLARFTGEDAEVGIKQLTDTLFRHEHITSFFQQIRPLIAAAIRHGNKNDYKKHPLLIYATVDKYLEEIYQRLEGEGPQDGLFQPEEMQAYNSFYVDLMAKRDGVSIGWDAWIKTNGHARPDKGDSTLTQEIELRKKIQADRTRRAGKEVEPELRLDHEHLLEYQMVVSAVQQLFTPKD